MRRLRQHPISGRLQHFSPPCGPLVVDRVAPLGREAPATLGRQHVNPVKFLTAELPEQERKPHQAAQWVKICALGGRANGLKAGSQPTRFRSAGFSFFIESRRIG